MKKNNTFVCPKCEDVNPKLILIEKWNKGEDSPYRLELFYLIETEDDYMYRIKIINLRKKSRYKITYTNHTCGQCHGPAKKITDDSYLNLIKRNRKLWRK